MSGKATAWEPKYLAATPCRKMPKPSVETTQPMLPAPCSAGRTVIALDEHAERGDDRQRRPSTASSSASRARPGTRSAWRRASSANPGRNSAPAWSRRSGSAQRHQGIDRANADAGQHQREEEIVHAPAPAACPATADCVHVRAPIRRSSALAEQIQRGRAFMPVRDLLYSFSSSTTRSSCFSISYMPRSSARSAVCCCGVKLMAAPRRRHSPWWRPARG